jgi:hypothetical protein
MNERTTQTLERELRGDEPTGTPDLGLVHRLGDRRRRARATLAGAGGVAAVAILAAVVGTGLSGGSTQGRDAPPAATHPHELAPLAQRALTEIPGATQVSDWQVVLPGPSQHPSMLQFLEPADVVGTPVGLGAHHYTGVTIYRPSAFPAWLYQGIEHIERTELGDENGYPVGSTDTGVLVDTGESYLGCVGKWSKTCGPALLTRADDRWVYEWGMGTEKFLKPGSPMEVFLSDDYSTGAAGQLVLAGLPGTDVARVDLVTTTGETVEGHVESGTVVPEQTMMWGRVPGEVAAVVAYDASGEVIEDHQLKPCGSPEDCEVR